MLSIADLPSLTVSTTPETQNNEPNLALAPEEIETLTSLMDRYDQVLLDIDSLTNRLQELLETEANGLGRAETTN